MDIEEKYRRIEEIVRQTEERMKPIKDELRRLPRTSTKWVFTWTSARDEQGSAYEKIAYIVECM